MKTYQTVEQLRNDIGYVEIGTTVRLKVHEIPPRQRKHISMNLPIFREVPENDDPYDISNIQYTTVLFHNLGFDEGFEFGYYQRVS